MNFSQLLVLLSWISMEFCPTQADGEFITIFHSLRSIHVFFCVSQPYPPVAQIDIPNSVS